MNDKNTPSKALRLGGAAGLLVAGAIGGAILAGTAAANADTASTDTSTSSSTSSTTGEGNSNRQSFPAHGTAAHEALEKPVTGANATKAQEAAVKAVGSGTAGAVTTDVSGNGYEVTVTKTDGTKVEVHLNGSFGLDDHGRLNGNG